MTRANKADHRAVLDLLEVTLEAAVPLHIYEIRDRSQRWLLGEAQRCATIVGSQGDVLQYGGKGCAAAFNALARGLAVAALVSDGGVTWRGQHWCRMPGCPSGEAHDCALTTCSMTGD
jgi:hypothetical protein